ncbi:MAG: hypothetical protein BGO52_06555 [Sphingobacteriales bacterium 44-61]|nr:MAG: hypothetical protein BGO52_06555 [Sphingobacteriales bacterium 44-61]
MDVVTILLKVIILFLFKIIPPFLSALKSKFLFHNAPTDFPGILFGYLLSIPEHVLLAQANIL